jgi:hypothetical protein
VRLPICRRRQEGSSAVEVVVETLDIVLAEVAAGLHLDQFEVDLADVLEPVLPIALPASKLSAAQVARPIVAGKHPVQQPGRCFPIVGPIGMRLGHEGRAGIEHLVLRVP